MKPYATSDELTTFLGTDAPSDADRQLTRASELLDKVVLAAFAVDADGLPTDDVIKSAMRDACCAQVELWIEVGEDNDIDGMAGTKLQIGGFQGERPPEVAPRALRILGEAGQLASRPVTYNYGTPGWTLP